ncbi:MAG: purine-nucleoside phosphorylase [Clostridia bacterium]|nr:purine-nucleoside phosphorylase [Clostridia bacterium]
MATPHINAEKGDFAKTVLMPGDPLRAKFIAENFLEDARLVTSVRNILGYTGTYKGKKVSVMASGMGMPSMGIYSYELFNCFDVENIIRIGTAGSIAPQVKLKSIIVGMSASFDSNFGAQFKMPGTYCPTASYKLLKAATDTAEELNLNIHVGNIFSSDLFYDDASTTLDWQKMGVLGVEMESAALYMNAARAGKNALCICTVSDELPTGNRCTTEERQQNFTDMMKLALEMLDKID